MSIVYHRQRAAWCDTETGACSGLGDAPQLPTYQTLAAVVEKKAGSGIRLLGWTLARAALIAPFMMMVGVSGRKAIQGSLLASAAISALAFLRISKATEEVVPALPPAEAEPKLSGHRRTDMMIAGPRLHHRRKGH